MRLSLTKKQAETPAGAELINFVKGFCSRKTCKLAEIDALEKLLLKIRSQDDLPAVPFLLEEIKILRCRTPITPLHRVCFGRTVERVLPPELWNFKSFGIEVGYHGWRRQKVTDEQIGRLRWWANKINEPMPDVRTKGEAHDVIDLWLAERPDLEAEWKGNEARNGISVELPISSQAVRPMQSTAASSGRITVSVSSHSSKQNRKIPRIIKVILIGLVIGLLFMLWTWLSS